MVNQGAAYYQQKQQTTTTNANNVVVEYMDVLFEKQNAFTNGPNSQLTSDQVKNKVIDLVQSSPSLFEAADQSRTLLNKVFSPGSQYDMLVRNAW